MAKRNYSRWRSTLPTNMSVDTDTMAAVQDLYIAVQDMGNEIDSFLRRNDDVFSEGLGIGNRLSATFDLDLSVDVGHLVYFVGNRAYRADSSDHTKRPMAVVDGVLGKSSGQRQGTCWFGQGSVDMATGDTSISVGSYIYLSSTPGLVSATPPEMDGSTVDYTAPVGFTLEDVSDGFVKAVFNPQMIVRLF
jgi:hypothetical protein